MTTPLVAYYTTASGPGATTEQAIPGASLGGYASTTLWSGGVLHDLFGRASSVDVAAARPDVRAVYLYNPDPTVTLTDVTVVVTAVTAGGAGVLVGVDPRPATFLDGYSTQLVEVSSGYTAPSGVTFAASVGLGDLPPGAGKGLWIRRTPLGAAGAPDDAADLTVTPTGETPTIRRVVWQTEPYGQTTAPVYPTTYTPTPSPFRRVSVDFLSQGGSRFTWQLDRTFQDAGPYRFQLQGSRVGTPDAPDWADVGPPAQDPVYLLDPGARLWGETKTWFYRAVLTTAAGSYVSPAAGVYGRLNPEQWLLVRELQRKEDLVLRRLAGLRGTLLKARRYGTRCTCADPTTGEVGNSADPVCYGTGYVGGYYPPVSLSFALPGVRSKTERVAYNEGLGTTLPDVLKARMLSTVPILTRDVWVHEGGDDRFHVVKIEDVASWQGVPVVYDVTMKLAPRSDVVYAVPIPRPAQPVPYWQQPTVLDV